MSILSQQIRKDIEAISQIEAVPSILEVICRSTGLGFSAVARVTDEKWIACAVRDEIAFGLQPGGELVLETTICNEIRQDRKLVVIDHVAEDARFVNHHTPAMYGFQSYISVPIILKNGSFFGTLCAIDPKPARVNTPEKIKMFELFAELISFHLSAMDRLAASEFELKHEQETAELREQFIAILGHDLLNPVSAVLNAAQMLLKIPGDERLTRLANIIKDSSFRVKALIDNILDFARGRLGEGITLQRNENEPLEEILKLVIDELGLVWPQRIINATFDLTEPVNSDGRRIAQLFSNLLGNALTHGLKDAPVTVSVSSRNGEFRLKVSNHGTAIDPKVIPYLFQPFYRGEVKPGHKGLGLGLYISYEIAKAHGGDLQVISSSQETSFILRMPSKLSV